jgi:uroporphyrin-III C-methyltransferase/precorrin-2 dehydrogenase/sirohydrochlorin ferrochelatase
VEPGTTKHQRCVNTTLDGMVRAAREHRIGSPAVVIIGRVAALARELASFTPQGTPQPELLDDGVRSYA